MNWIDINIERPENGQEVIAYADLTLTIRNKQMRFEELCSCLYDSETNTFIDRYHKVIAGVLFWCHLPEKPIKPCK